MNEAGEGKFKMKGDAAETDLYRDEMVDLRVEKLSHRLTLLTILVPILLGVVLVIAYLDVKKRVSTFYVSGTTGVANLSKDLESRFSSLSLKMAALEEAMATQQASLEKSVISIRGDLKKTHEQLAKAVLSAQNDHKRVSAAVQKVDRGLEPVAKETVALRADLTTFGTKTSEALSMLGQSLKPTEEKINSLSKEISVLSARSEAKVDQKGLELALNSQKQVMSQELEVAKTGLQAKILSLEKQIDLLADNLAKARTPSTMPPAPAVKPLAPKSPVPGAPPVSKQPAGNRIIEQDIKE